MPSANKPTTGNDNLFLDKKGETVHALGGDDNVTGGVGNDTIYGDDGNDFLLGGGGNDALYGGAGNDVLQGGSGKNLLDGGNGSDTANYAWYQISDQPTFISLRDSYAVDQSSTGAGAAPALGTGQTFNDTLTGIENVTGAPNTPNHIVGDINNNVLVGGLFDDLIEGGLGNDTLTGAGGKDTFFVDLTSDFPINFGEDHITDYTAASGDTLSFRFTGFVSVEINTIEGSKYVSYHSAANQDGPPIATGTFILDNYTGGVNFDFKQVV